MTEQRLWTRFALALERFHADPSPRNEGVVVQRYSDFARSFCPEQADELISLLIRHLARALEDRKAA